MSGELNNQSQVKGCRQFIVFCIPVEEWWQVMFLFWLNLWMEKTSFISYNPLSNRSVSPCHYNAVKLHNNCRSWHDKLASWKTGTRNTLWWWCFLAKVISFLQLTVRLEVTDSRLLCRLILLFCFEWIRAAVTWFSFLRVSMQRQQDYQYMIRHTSNV